MAKLAKDDKTQFLNLDEWLNWQECLNDRSIELGLDRCRQVADRLDLLTPDCWVITVAGTNGKGSSVKILDQILSLAGYHVGTYTSPHLLRYNERICIDGEPVDDELICEAFAQVEDARGNTCLTYFEFGTLAALNIFKAHGLDIIILEVGLGGRLDAVNILDTDAALLCSIDLDHQEWLGDDRESIGYEKAGILRSGIPAVCADDDPPTSVLQHASSLNIDLACAGRDYHYRTEKDCWHWYSERTSLENLPYFDQHATFQLNNAAGVLMLLEKMQSSYHITEQNIKDGLSSFRLPGRMQVLEKHGIEFVLDVAHNHEAFKMLGQHLERMPCRGKRYIVLGMFAEKSHQACITSIERFIDQWHIVSIDSRRGCGADQLLISLAGLPTQCQMFRHHDIADGLESVMAAAQAGDQVIISGSFLVVGGAMKHLKIVS